MPRELDQTPVLLVYIPAAPGGISHIVGAFDCRTFDAHGILVGWMGNGVSEELLAAMIG